MIGDVDQFKRKNRSLGLLLVMLAVVVGAGILLPEPSEANRLDKTIVLDKIEFNPYVRDADTPMPGEKAFVLMEFFTTACHFCKKSVPELNALHASETVSVVAYTSDGGRRVRGFIEEFRVHYPVSRASLEYMRTFSPVAYPVSYLVDTETLKVEARFFGKVDKAAVLETAHTLAAR